jgi:hypothetical protein
MDPRRVLYNQHVLQIMDPDSYHNQHVGEIMDPRPISMDPDPYSNQHVLKIMEPRPASLSACFENYGTKTRIIISMF